MRYILLLALALTACYRFPTEDDYSLVPSTNNPTITREKGNHVLPTPSF